MMRYPCFKNVFKKQTSRVDEIIDKTSMKLIYNSWLFIVISLLVGLTGRLSAQSNASLQHTGELFNENAAYLQAKQKGVKSSEIKGYVEYLKHEFSSTRALKKQTHVHSPYEYMMTPTQETVIVLNPNKEMGLGCPNMGFEQYNFNGWNGSIGTVSVGAVNSTPTYYIKSGSTITNPAGNNVSLLNASNYHTLMTLPALDANYLTINGYDSLACKAVGSQTISQIPVVSPYSFDPISVRMNGALAGNRACKLKYVATSSPTNQRLSFSYAFVLQNPVTDPHLPEESPYFKVEVKNESTGTIIYGCTSYTFNPKTMVPSDSVFQSVIDDGIDPTLYRKWNFYSIDLSQFPDGTSISVNFEVGGCTSNGHWAYAYVDAECGGIGIPYANKCSGSSLATLIAPKGFRSYQWYGPSGLIPGATNDTLVQNPVTVGSTYTVSMLSSGGCVITQTLNIIDGTIVKILDVNATSSCAGGKSGRAFVEAKGSSGTYNYKWTNTSSGQVVSTSQLATGLSSGSYSVEVFSPGCGRDSYNFSIGVSPPFFYAQPKLFCGTTAFIAQPGGSSYSWYKGSALLSGLNNDTLVINNPVSGDAYTLGYYNDQGCRDSLKYTLNKISGGNAYFSNNTSSCSNYSNGTSVLTLSPYFAPPYSCVLTGDGNGRVVSNNPTFTISTLAAGNYSATIYDGLCVYHRTLSIGSVQTDFTVTPKAEGLCFPDQALMKLNLLSSNYTVSVSSNGIITANYTNDSIAVAPTFTIPPSGNGSVVYTVSVVNPDKGCVVSKTAEIIYPPLATTVQVVSTNTNLCEGTSNNFTANGAINYKWYYDDGVNLIPIATTYSVIITPTLTGMHHYVVNGYSSCTGNIPDTKTITVKVVPKETLQMTALKDVAKCLNTAHVFTTNVSSSISSNTTTPVFTYSWTTLPGHNPAPGVNTSPDYSVTSNQTTTLVLTVDGFCVNKIVDTAVVKNLADDLNVLILDSVSICPDRPFILNSKVDGGYPDYLYEWTMSPNSSTISNSSMLDYKSPEAEGIYSVALSVMDSCSYRKTDTQMINVLPPCHIIIPNVMTANGDGVNDIFVIKNIEHHPNTRLIIFDRWGLKIYEKDNYNNEWKEDGIKATGTFFYVIEVPDDKTYSGFITILKP
jgi:gliding motility-associated-like protein